MKKLFTILILLGVTAFGQSGTGHDPNLTLSYTPGGYSTPTKMRQASGSTAVAKNTITSADATDLFVNFIFDTSGKNVYIKYTINGSAPSKTNGIEVTCGSVYYSDPNRTWKGTIPSLSPGLEIKYVFYISNSDVASAWGRVAANGYLTTWTEGDSYFSFRNRHVTTGSGGDWNTATTWDKSTIPSASTDEVELNHSVTLDGDEQVSLLQINLGGTFNGGSNNLTISPNGSIVNNGTFTASTGKVSFTGATTLTGTIGFNNVDLGGGVNFGSASTINGLLQINAGGFCNTNGPFYADGSTLQYNIDYSLSTEWYASAASGQGVPYNVVINGGNVYFANTAFVYRQLRNDLTINASKIFALSETAGGDLRIGGDFINNGTFTANGRSVLFNGSATQDISGSGSGDFAYVDINNGNGVTLSRNITIGNQLKLSNGNLTLGASSVSLGSSSLLNSSGLGSVSDFSNTNMVITNGTGTLNRTVAASAIVFPIGYSATYYNPVTITNSGTSRTFSVYAKSTPTNAGYNVKYVNCFWNITPNGAEVNSSLIFQWNAAQEDPSFARGDATLHIGRWTGTVWDPKLATLGGSGPYTATATGFTAFSEFGVGSNGALPVELTSFNAAIRNGLVDLKWETATEVNNYGFEVERKSTNADWSKIGFVEGHGSTNSPKYYSYSDKPEGTGKIAYRLKQIDNDGQFEYSPEVEVLVDNLPNGFVLEQNYPNPFNPETSIRFALKEDTKATLKVYNSLGAEIATLFDGTAEAGRYYDVKFGGSELASGFYIYKLVAGEYVSVKKMLLMK